jgi:helicase
MQTVEILDDSKGDSFLDIVLNTLARKKQALVFANSKRSVEKSAEDVSKELEDCEEGVALSENVLKALSTSTKQCRRLATCLRKGIAFHHSGLVAKQREIVEEGFDSGKIKIICSTPTLALGISLPAFRTIIKDIKRYTSRGMQYIPVMEYHQICGRAGRPGKETEGEAIVLANEKNKEQIVKKFLKGKPEDILSKLAVEPVLRTFLLSLISAEFIGDNKQINSFFKKTFWAHQYQDVDELIRILEKTLEDLEKWEFIETIGKNDNNSFQSADSLLENYSIRATDLGKRVSQLYLDPLSAHKLIESLKKYNEAKKGYFSYLYGVVNTNEMRPFLNVKNAEMDRLDVMVSRHKEDLINTPEPWDEEYEDFLSVFKTTLLLNNWVHEKDEEFILERFSVRPGELQYKLNNADWLLYSSQELARILSLKDAQGILIKLRLRIKYGVKNELLGLLKLKGIGRVRARKLFDSGFKDMGALKKGDFGLISKSVGPSVAKNIKEQLGVKVEFEYKNYEGKVDVIKKQKTLLEF